MARLQGAVRPRSITQLPRVRGVRYDLLDELIGYALRRAQVSMFAAFHEATRGMNITPPRFTALVFIGANPGMSQAALGTVLGIARSGAMLLIDWFEAQGLVERRRQPKDRRAWGLHLTPRGQQLVDRLKRKVAELERRRAASLSERERHELLRLLDKLSSVARSGA